LSTTQPKSVEDSVCELKQRSDQLKTLARQRETFPDPALVLDLESRMGDRRRTIRHIHLTSSAHVWHYIAVGRIKLIYLMDGYVFMVEQRNPLAVFAMARSLLEFHVSAAHLESQLRAIVNSHPSDLLTRGKEFFLAIVRARYSTKDPALRNRLMQLGTPEKHLSWPKINAYVKELAKKSELAWVADHYTLLCEYVHHNLPSTAIAVTSLPYGTHSRNRMGIMITDTPGPQITYAWPSDAAADGSVQLTASRALASVDSILEILKNILTTPYTPNELRRETGTRFGAKTTFPAGKIPGRNEPCWCGSGVKFKKCHG
jgi:hypothetical protein